jgi:signal peptidase I
MGQLLIKLHNFFDGRKKKVFKTPKKTWKQQLNEFMMRNFGVILLIITILLFISFIIFTMTIIGGSCLESGNYYNHIGDVA